MAAPVRGRRCLLPWLLTLVAGFAAGSSIPARAQPGPEAGWSARFEPGGGRGWQLPREPLVIGLTGLSAADMATRLSLELDAVDVTALVEFGAQGLSFMPAEALAPGEHELRLIEFTPEGEILERGLWRFEVRQTRTFREIGWQPAGELVARQRVSERGLDPRPDEALAQASLRLDGRLAGRGYRVQANNALVHDSSLGEDRTQLYEFLLSGGSERFMLRAGQHQVAGSSLIRENFLRRGLSASFRAGRSELTAYALRSDTQTGIDDALGLNDPDRITTGISARFAPLADDPGRLVLHAGFLRGRGREAGIAEVGDGKAGAEPEGDAWQLGIDSYHLDGRLRLYGEYARSQYDFDGAGQGFAPEQDDAFNLLARYRPAGGGEGPDWSASVQLQQVGSAFRSIANSALPNDKRILSTQWRLVQGGLSANLLLALERDNLDNRRSLPTIESRVLRLDFGWSPSPPEREPRGLWRLLANPWYQLAYAQAGNRQVDDPLAYLGDDTDNLNRDLALSASFSPGAWSWTLDYQANRFDEDAGVLSSTRNDMVGLSLALPLLDGLDLSPAIQLGRGEERATGVRSDELSASLGLALRLGRLSASADYSYSRLRLSDDSTDTLNQNLGLALDYRLLDPRAHRPGLGLFVSATWADGHDRAQGLGVPLSRQIYIGLRTSLAPAGAAGSTVADVPGEGL